MKVVKLNCTACGAPISVPDHLDQLNCSACGSLLQVDRGEGYITLRILEKISQAIETSGKETTAAIKESSYVTKTELQKLQIQQEIIANQTILANFESEIRSLKRSGLEKVNMDELDSLYAKQYQILDKLRILEQKYLSPESGDVHGQISATQKEISYIDQELSVLYISNIKGKNDAIRALNKMRTERVDFVTNLRANEIRKNYPILLQKSFQVDDTQKALDYINTLTETEQIIQSLPDSAEKILLVDEIKRLKEKLSKDWSELEKARLSVMLHFIPPIPEDEDLENLVAKLGFMNENVNILRGQNHNWVVQELLTENITRRDNLQKRISKVEKQLQKEQAKLAKVLSSDNKKAEMDDRIQLGFGTIFASVGVLLGGLWLAVKSAFPQKNAESDLVTLNSEIIEGEELKQKFNPPYLKYKSIEDSSNKSIKKGILYFVIVLLTFSCIGTILLMMVEVIFSIETSNITVGLIFLILLISLLIAQKIFLSQTLGLVYIKGKLGIPNIYLSNNHPTYGIKNSTIVKILVGFFVFISFGLLITTIAAFIPFTGEGKPSDFAAIFIVLGIMMSPIISLVAGLRTEIVSNEPFE